MRLKNLWQKSKTAEEERQAQARAEKARRDIAVPNLRTSYETLMSNLLARHDSETAMSLAVGGDYEKMGDALRVRLERFGLGKSDYLIDVGCGSGRLAYAVSRSRYRDSIRYLGIDLVPAMLEFAATKCQRPSWRFETVAEPKIPEMDDCADMVCFFSVFTHLLQEESFLYLQEARRVLKPGGKIVASYLDIADPRHWEIFEANVKSTHARQSKPMDIFLSADFVEVWSEKLDLTILEDRAPNCGQRTCLLQKR